MAVMTGGLFFFAGAGLTMELDDDEAKALPGGAVTVGVPGNEMGSNFGACGVTSMKSGFSFDAAEAKAGRIGVGAGLGSKGFSPGCENRIVPDEGGGLAPPSTPARIGLTLFVESAAGGLVTVGREGRVALESDGDGSPTFEDCMFEVGMSGTTGGLGVSCEDGTKVGANGFSLGGGGGSGLVAGIGDGVGVGKENTGGGCV